MRMPFAKPDPIADAEVAVAKLETQRARLADRLAGAVERVEAAQAARLAALTDGDPTPAELGKLDRACLEAAGARAGLDDAARTIAAQLAATTATRDRLKDVAARALVAVDAERRAAALDTAAEALAAAAGAFREAGDAMARAVAEHGVRVDNVLSISGSTSAILLARPIVQAALRMAAPSLHEAANGLGVPYDADPVMVARRAQSGRLRDHIEDVKAGTVPALDLPRLGAPGVTPPDRNDPFSVKRDMVQGVFREPFTYLATGGALMQGEPGHVEVPRDVMLAAIEMEIAATPGTRLANEILAAVKADVGRPDYHKKRPGAPGGRRIFIDTDDGVVNSAPVRTATWPEADREVARR